MSETVNWNVDSETGSFVSMGSDAEISGLNNGSSDPLGAVPRCLELELTENLEASEMGNFDFMDGGSESIPCLGMSSVDMETSSGRRDPPNDAPSGYTGSNLKACSEKSSTNVTPEASLEDTQVSERLCQLAETNGTSRTIPGTLGLWALVVDAAPKDVKDVSEGWLATMIKDTELEEAAYDEDFLLVRAVTTGWKYHEEGVRDIDELVAAGVESVEDDVTDEEMLIDLIQMIREVFDQVGSPCPRDISVECGMDNGALS